MNQTADTIYHSDQEKAIILQQDLAFGDLSSTLRGFIQAYSEGQRELRSLLRELFDGHADVIKGVVRTETLQSQQHIINAVSFESEKSQQSLAREAIKTREDVVEQANKTREGLIQLLKDVNSGPPLWESRRTLISSLKHPDADERWNQIPDNHEGTYEWVLHGVRHWLDPDERETALQEGASHLHPDCSHTMGFPNVTWRCFRCWLGSPDEKVYWIQGKPGSGKSTLMKFLVSECSGLGWSSEQPVIKDGIVLSYFLWMAGSPMQRSIRGILLALIHQFLTKQDRFLDEIIKSIPQAAYKRMHNEWPREDLEYIANTWFGKCDKPVFIFLDGLDEMPEDDFNMVDTPANLLRLVNNLASIERVKLCVSSRQEPFFQRRLGDVPTLRLQDLTWRDMEFYAKRHLWEPELDPESDGFQDLITGICEKADGVFLWLALAVRNMANGIAKGDNLVELNFCLRQMPRGLHSLYQTMWARTNDDQKHYREEAAQYFNMVRCWSQLAMGSSLIEVFHLMMALEPSKAIAIVQGTSILSPEDIEHACQVSTKRVTARTAGLLEVDSQNRLVGFIHRSALEFLENTTEGREILSYDPTAHQVRVQNLAYAYMAGICLEVLDQRESRAHSVSSKYSVMGTIHQLWKSGDLSADAAYDLMQACKRLFGKGPWGDFPFGKDSAQSVQSALDFYGVSAKFGFSKFISTLVRRSEVSDLTRRYLFVAACLDPNVPSDFDFTGKALIISDILEQDTVFDLEDHSSALPLMFFATMNIYMGDRQWPTVPGVPSLPSLLDQYLGTSYSLEDRITFTMKWTPGLGDECWAPTPHCIGTIETTYNRQSATWIAFETDLASMARLCLEILIAGSETAHELEVAHKALEKLKAARPQRHMKVLAFGFYVMNGLSSAAPRNDVGGNSGKLLAPATAEDGELVLACLFAHLRPHPVESPSDFGTDLRGYDLPGLLDCLKGIAPGAQQLNEDEFEKARDLPLQRAMVELMTNASKATTE